MLLWNVNFISPIHQWLVLTTVSSRVNALAIRELFFVAVRPRKLVWVSVLELHRQFCTVTAVAVLPKRTYVNGTFQECKQKLGTYLWKVTFGNTTFSARLFVGWAKLGELSDGNFRWYHFNACLLVGLAKPDELIGWLSSEIDWIVPPKVIVREYIPGLHSNTRITMHISCHQIICQFPSKHMCHCCCCWDYFIAL